MSTPLMSLFLVKPPTYVVWDTALNSSRICTQAAVRLIRTEENAEQPTL